MRETKKAINGNYVIGTYILLKEPWKSLANKLGPLEDKEEKLGIDLNFFLSLIIDGAYFKVPKEISDVLRTSYDENEIVYKHPSSAEINKEGITIEFYDRWDNTVDPEKYFYSINDYGKTWASTKEELL